MKYPHNIRQQLKGLTADELIRALERDGWALDVGFGKGQVYRHPDGRHVSVHYHPGSTYKPGLRNAILDDIGWSIDDLKRLKLVK